MDLEVGSRWRGCWIKVSRSAEAMARELYAVVGI